MREPFSKDRFRRPERFWDEFLRKGVKGLFMERDEVVPVLYRAVVVGVDTEGGKLENPSGTGQITHNFNGNTFDCPARHGPENPPNSVKARLITDGLDRFVTDEDLRVFWPFFPETSMVPIKPGEHVYVMFEDPQKIHGLWLSKVSGHTGVNYAPGEKTFVAPDQGSNLNKFPDTQAAVSSTDQPPKTNDDAAEQTSGDRLTSKF